MSAIIFGANGYIGFAVAQVLRQHGYTVYGVIRKQEYAHKLATHEIIPVVADVSKPETYEGILQKASIVIDTVQDYQANVTVLEETQKHSSSHGKKIYIFTSGGLVHGNSSEVFQSEEVFREEDIHGGPIIIEFIRQRRNFEAQVIQANQIHGIVIRPSVVYGYAGGNGGTHLGDKVFQLTDGKIQISGSDKKRWSWVHIYDLARAYLLAVQKFTVASGQIFDITQSENSPTYGELRKKAAEVAGHKNAPILLLPIGESFERALENSVRVSNRKAQNLLGWNPGHFSLLDDLLGVYTAYIALKNQK